MTNASTNQTETTKLTQATHDRLVAELEDLTTRGRVEIAQHIEAARALGDLSENGDYHAAKDAQGKMESRIRQLQAMLKDVEIVDESGSADGSVSLGSTVELRYEGDDEDDTPALLRGLHRGAPGRSARDLAQLAPGPGAGGARRRRHRRVPGTGRHAQGAHRRRRPLMAPRTLSEKIWDAHVVHAAEGEPDLLFIDLHLVHEVTSPQAFDGLRLAGRTVRRPDLTVATADHNVPTTDIDKPVADPISAQQLLGPQRQHGRVRHHLLPDGRRQPGHRPHHRARAGLDAAGHDHRVRRQPHLDPRGLRRARPSASAPARWSTCWRPRRCPRCGPRPWR